MPPTPDTSSVTDWMQAWGSLISVGLTLLAVLFTALLLRHEIRVRREERAEADAAQARLIVLTKTSLGDPGPCEGLIHNYSGAPVHDVLAFIARHDGKIRFIGFFATIEPRGQGQWQVELEVMEAFGAHGQLAVPVVDFTDTNGVPWRIGSAGLVRRRLISAWDRTIPSLAWQLFKARRPLLKRRWPGRVRSRVHAALAERVERVNPTIWAQDGPHDHRLPR